MRRDRTGHFGMPYFLEYILISNRITKPKCIGKLRQAGSIVRLLNTFRRYLS